MTDDRRNRYPGAEFSTNESDLRASVDDKMQRSKWDQSTDRRLAELAALLKDILDELRKLNHTPE